VLVVGPAAPGLPLRNLFSAQIHTIVQLLPKLAINSRRQPPQDSENKLHVAMRIDNIV
jgi:hypothetical protein